MTEWVPAETIEGGKVVDANGENLGVIEDVMIDVNRGAIACAVMACTFPGQGDRLLAVPWSALRRDPARGCFVLDADRETLALDTRFTYR